MGIVTRRALRVYAALKELRETNGDILDALIPFFEPILSAMNGRPFDPRLFAFGVQKLYRWRFTGDVAQQFIPRLTNKGYLKRVGSRQEKDVVYIVTFDKAAIETNEPAITDFVESIVTEFEAFPPRVTDLLVYQKSREQLTDMLIRFLVSLDAYGETELIQEVQRAALGRDAQTFVAQLDEGGEPLAPEDRYICARFVKHLMETKPAYVPELARLASIGLLTEVVTDFIKPTQTSSKVQLSVIVDAPLALDFLGCSGKALASDIREIISGLKAIGCSFVVLPISCVEMKRNLDSMLRLPVPRRHGYTHDAMVRNEVMTDYVIAVAQDPEGALERAGMQVRHIDLTQFPHQQAFFDMARHDDFLSTITWGQGIEPREHDATCMTLVMRLRQGKHFSDALRCGHIFVTRNGTFVRGSREYCIRSQLLTPLQQGPVIHQRELATIAWLRTGLGADDQIPRGHLLATCERVLRVNPEVKNAVGNVLRQVTPEKFEQFEILLADHKSVRKLADETLNDETVVTADNAERLFEVMKRAAIEDERLVFEQALTEERAKHRKQQTEARAETTRTRSELDAVRAKLAADEKLREQTLRRLIQETNRLSNRISFAVSTAFVVVGLAALLDQLTGVLTGATGWVSLAWRTILLIAGVIGGYHLITDALQKPQIGLVTVLDWLARRILLRKLKQKELLHYYPIQSFNLKNGRFEPTKRIETLAPPMS